MHHFPSKRFNGSVYSFQHLSPTEHAVSLNAANTVLVKIQIRYSIHCFTVAFDSAVHRDHHKYAYATEIRAFDLERYRCSLYLPALITNLSRVKVYRARKDNYTYVAKIFLGGQTKPYSIFFELRKRSETTEPTVQMYVQSAYLSPLKVSPHAQSWRFGSLVGQLIGVFPPAAKNKQPKKKAP